MATASSDVSSALKFAKLNGTNYRSWTFNIRLYLESMDLFEFADGSAESPAEDASDEIRMKFNSRAKKHGHIFVWLSILNNKYMCGKQRLLKRLGMSCKDNLRENRYYKRSDFVNSIIRVNFALVTTCLITSVINLKSLHDQLKEMGVNIDHKELVMTLLASLPEKYKTIARNVRQSHYYSFIPKAL